MGHDFHERLRQGFLQIGLEEPERCVVIDATASIEQVGDAIRAIVSERFSLALI
jgi:dTMP kinase